MMNTKRKVEISLLGQRFSIRTERDDDYMLGLTRFVAQKLDETRKQTRAVSTHHVAILVALNLSDQLFTAQEELTQLKAALRDRAESALKQVGDALSHFPTKVEPTEV